ncbi:HD domain-containing protein [Pseudobutyrivibrio sp. 49]|uniref:HD-GYP domain-containing protein n=1 Tax=unclassified Pseudobutyrivibrio TaxID=2638619 RepID=UPI000889269C|nr:MULTISPECIES: HD domain-containing phosphohydrolase [unclassified Pseudobutyrivibrio]SDI62672.1 HD domain-containing protein [Pseudobutyrivibrio sp. 49]SFO28449.1 HD domain-containing protein [Pseudobutyrivibrio sp. UC1225]
MAILDYFILNWPKLIFAAWFSIYNLILVAVFLKEHRYLIERFLVGFFVSSAFMSIIAEIIGVHFYNLIIDNGILTDPYDFFFIAVSIFFDALFIFIGGNLFTHFTGLKNYVGASIYMEYVCLERLCLVVATNITNYILLYIFFQFALFAIMRKNMAYLFKATSLKWRSIFIYLTGLFYILDLLYAAYLLFPELGTNVINIQNLFWLDSMALITCSFVSGYISISISESKEHDGKIEYFERLQKSQEDIITTLAEMSEAKSGETGQHVRRVAEYSRLLAYKLGLSKEECEDIKIAAMMHDLGKLMISKEIIEKPAKLTPAEYDIVKQHTQYGWDILSNSEGDLMKMARVIAVQHHEYWNGQGYPLGISGNGISIYAQIVAVADVFDALTSERSYKRAWTSQEAYDEIIKQRGEQFSPRVVDAFIECYNQICVIRDTYLD